MFAVVIVGTEEQISEPYATGELASIAAREMNEGARASGIAVRYRVKKLDDPAPSSAWEDRETARFMSDEYKPVPWYQEAWARDPADRYSLGGKFKHFAHVAHGNNSMVAFTADNSAGVRDTQRRMRPGRYLERYFADVLSADQIREWCAAWSADNEDIALQYATTPKDIERVYTNGPDSCMSHDASDYESPCHPVRVYGAGDLSVAYIERDERITARVLLWPAKKIVGRIYGDLDRMVPLLRDAGYTDIETRQDYNGTWGDFEGAKLLRIEQDDGRFVCPWLDNPNCRVSDDGSHLVISRRGEYDGQETDGLIGEEQGNTCEHCDNRMSDDDSYRVGDETWCESCYNDDSFGCNDCNNVLAGSPDYTDRHGNDICEECAREYETCAECNETTHSDDCTYSELDNATYCDGCYRDLNETPCGERTREDPATACDCQECTDHARDNFALADGNTPAPREEPSDRWFPVRLKPTSPTVFCVEQYELPLREHQYHLRNARAARGYHIPIYDDPESVLSYMEMPQPHPLDQMLAAD